MHWKLTEHEKFCLQNNQLLKQPTQLNQRIMMFIRQLQNCVWSKLNVSYVTYAYYMQHSLPIVHIQFEILHKQYAFACIQFLTYTLIA